MKIKQDHLNQEVELKKIESAEGYFLLVNTLPWLLAKY